MNKPPAPLFVVGLGPGSESELTLRARQILAETPCLAGYGLYLDLLPESLKSGKKLIESGMRRERERCSLAVDSALAGTPTALLSSGDPGVYALASLAIEELERKNLLETVPLEIVPGVPALCAAAARLGAPLGHDFACVSLSDLLTPLDVIKNRLHAALEADFVCVLYNPRSRGRPDYLALALDMAKARRSPACPVALARNIARKGESVTVSTLADFNPNLADMLSLVIVGSNSTRAIGPYVITPRGYYK